MAFLAFSSYGISAWIPTFLIRNPHWSLAQAGFTINLIHMVCGTSGIVCGRRGRF
ncbi:hypothetical protein [Singulisphaera sp. GP187]|uniref:hypothetical protein n=1 Tax=Singulisphaera sp. GP187 TaxID=1882752 RepID=UPI0013563921|nr:hypothetical protein [Singulisphaera sp. GP187]